MAAAAPPNVRTFGIRRVRRSATQATSASPTTAYVTRASIIVTNRPPDPGFPPAPYPAERHPTRVDAIHIAADQLHPKKPHQRHERREQRILDEVLGRL